MSICIIGGMGPSAGVDLFNQIIENTIADSDQEHLDVMLYSFPSRIEDRSAYLKDKTLKNPGIAIADIALKAEKNGATLVAIACNTAHSEPIFSTIKSELNKRNSQLELLHMVELTAKYIKDQFPRSKNIGLLSTIGTYKSKLYDTIFEKEGLNIITPDKITQKNLIHNTIYDPINGIKANNGKANKKNINNLLKSIKVLQDQKSEIIILGCSEIPLFINNRIVSEIQTIDPNMILARALIERYEPNKLKPLKKPV